MGQLRGLPLTPVPVSSLHLVVPGPLDQRTGGYIYDARMVKELRELGWAVSVHTLPGRFPQVDERAREALAGALAGVEDGALVVVDGLALCALPEVAEAHADRLRLVALVHHPLGDETGLGEEARARFLALELRTLAAVAGVVVTSDFTRARLGELGVDTDRVVAVLPGTDRAAGDRPPPGVDRDVGAPAAGDTRRDGAPAGDDPVHLLCVGTVTPRKGHDLLVAALERIAGLQWRCTCAGSLDRDPSYAARVTGAVAAAGLEDRVTFTGELDAAELDRLYALAHLFVLPSWYEGYGMALTEALVRGLPVVSTRGGAIPWTVPEEAGVLVTPGSVEELADALRALMEDADRRRALAAAARVHGDRLPGWGEQARAFARALERLGTRPGSRRGSAGGVS